MDSVALTSANLPAHTHPLSADTLDAANLNTPGPNMVLAQSSGVSAYQPDSGNLTAMANESIAPNTGGINKHNNMQPFMALTYCIAVSGILPAEPTGK